MSDALSADGEARETTLSDVVRWLSRHWWRLSLCAALCGLAAFLVVRQLPLQYTATATIVPVSAEGADGGVGSTIAGIASLAGVETGGAVDQTQVALAIAESRAFIEAFLIDRGLTDRMLVDDRARAAPLAVKRERAFKRFAGSFSIKAAEGGGIIKVAVTWSDPIEAAEWTNDIVRRLNLSMRNRTIANAQQRRQFLEAELSRNQNVELRLAITDMIARELKNLMMARQPSGAAFEVIDPAVAPVTPSGPRIVVLTGAGVIFGLLVGILWGLLARPRTKF